jgi:hypothetical protein
MAQSDGKMESYDVHLWSFLLYSYPCKEDRKEIYDFFPLIKENTVSIQLIKEEDVVKISFFDDFVQL